MRRKKINLMLALSLVSLVGCGGGDSSSDGDGNKAPIVNAGSDKTTIVNQPVTIMGTATDEDGTISSYEWKKGSDTLGTEASLTYTPTAIGTDILTFVVMDDDGASSSDEVKIVVKEENALPTADLPTVSHKSSSKIMQKAENEIIKSAISTLSFGYYRDEGKEQWYISHINLSSKSDVYSLTPFRDGKNGWGTVGKNVASFDSKAENVKIDFIPDSNDYRYFDAGWNDWNVDPMIQEHISKIRNDNVNVEWWFFQATNGSWYIVNKAGSVLKFSSKNGEYDWIEIDMGGSKPIFFIEGEEKKMKFGTTDTTSTDTSNTSTNAPYPKAVIDSKYYRVPDNAFHKGLYGQCTWYVYGRYMELYAKGLISKKAHDTLYNGLYGTHGRDARKWASKLGIEGQGFLTKNDVLPLNKRKRGLLAVWECGKFGHVGFVEEIGGANKEWYILSDSNKAGDEKYQEKKYKFDYRDNVSGAVDDKLRVIGGSCYPTFYDLEK